VKSAVSDQAHPDTDRAMTPLPLGANVLEVNGVWKKFCKTKSGTRRDLYSNVFRAFFGLRSRPARLREDEFWAVQDVSFTLPRGKTLGVLGLNGAGKTTLLNMIGGMMQPDRGQIRGVGAVGALMNMAAGLQPALTARENIFVGGAVRGWSRQDTLEKFDEIISFAELEPHLDRRLVDFSSGMRMRLAFSIAIHMNPDLLLIDEVLAVGDHSFREKCQSKLSSIAQDAAVIIVSHSVRDIRSYCDQALLLRDGRMSFYGDVEEGLALLLESYHHGAIKPGTAEVAPQQEKVPKTYLAADALEDVQVTLTPQNRPVDKHDAASELTHVCIRFRCLRHYRDLSIGLALYDAGGEQLVGAASPDTASALQGLEKGAQVQIQATIDLSTLAPGQYPIQVVIAQGDTILYDARAGIIERPQAKKPVWGLVHLPAAWDMRITPPQSRDEAKARKAID